MRCGQGRQREWTGASKNLPDGRVAQSRHRAARARHINFSSGAPPKFLVFRLRRPGALAPAEPAGWLRCQQGAAGRTPSDPPQLSLFLRSASLASPSVHQPGFDTLLDALALASLFSTTAQTAVPGSTTKDGWQRLSQASLSNSNTSSSSMTGGGAPSVRSLPASDKPRTVKDKLKSFIGYDPVVVGAASTTDTILGGLRSGGGPVAQVSTRSNGVARPASHGLRRAIFAPKTDPSSPFIAVQGLC